MTRHRYIEWETVQERRRRLRPWLLVLTGAAVLAVAAGAADAIRSPPLTDDDSVVATVTSTAQPLPSITPRTFPEGTP